jgi:hypothetical protein
VKLSVQSQAASVTDTTRAKFAMVRPVLTATLHSLKRSRIERLGGIEKVTLEDLAREYREGSGDCGICFEYAVHEGLLAQSKYVYPRVSEVLETFCGLKEGAESILFGLEKGDRLGLIETAAHKLTDESRVLVGKTGQPPKLKKHIATICEAFRSVKHRELLPRSIRGLWRTDLFVGSTSSDRWVATTLKINPADLEADAGIRIGIYPERQRGERPSLDESRNLILCHLPYNGAFIELFYASFFIVKTVLAEDARLPHPVQLYASDDRYVAQELVGRRGFPVEAIVEAFGRLAQPELIAETVVGDVGDEATDAVAPVARTE